MARSPVNGERRLRRLRAVGNFVAEEPTPLPDSQERECKRLRILFLHNEHRFREEILRLAVEERECKRLHARRRVLFQRTEHHIRQEILRLAAEERGDPGETAPEAAKKAPKSSEALAKSSEIKSTQDLHPRPSRPHARRRGHRPRGEAPVKTSTPGTYR